MALGLCLSHATWAYEILNEPEKAIDMAQKAFYCALEKLDDLGEQEYKDATILLALLRDNSTLWMEEQEEKKKKGQTHNQITLSKK